MVDSLPHVGGDWVLLRTLEERGEVAIGTAGGVGLFVVPVGLAPAIVDATLHVHVDGGCGGKHVHYV